MVYARPVHSQTLIAAIARKRQTQAAYFETIDALPRESRDAIHAYVRAVGQEAAARRAEADRLRKALEARTGRSER